MRLKPIPSLRSLVAIALLIAALPGCVPPPEGLALSGETMGTSFSLKLGQSISAARADRLSTDVDQLLAELNAGLSNYEPASEVTLFNELDDVGWVPVSDMLAAVVERALLVAELSNGAYDITAAPIIEAWGFGPAASAPRIPPDAEIQAAGKRVDFRRLQARRDPPALRKLSADTRLDLSGVAKGYAVDRLAELLESRGITNYLVEIGGELRSRGRRGNGGPWRVGIERPEARARTVARILPMRRNAALATSGDYRNYFEINGQRYPHILDPRTGRPVEHALASVTVLAERCADADALATALAVLGPDDGLALAEERGLAALFLVREEQGFTERSTPAFDQFINP